MPYDEVDYRRLEEELGEGEEIRRGIEDFDFSKEELKTQRHENIALVICFAISFVFMAFVFGGSS